MTVSRLVRIGILAGMAFVMMLVEFPLPFFPDFLKYDVSDLAALVAAFAMGPWVGVVVQLVKNLLYLFLSGRGNPVGVLGNFLAGSILVLVAGIVYQRYTTKKGAVLALVSGSVAMGLGMIPLNLFILFPLYGIQLEPSQFIPMMLGVVLPFNLVKGFLSSTATFVLYKRVRGFLREDLALVQLDSQEQQTP